MNLDRIVGYIPMVVTGLCGFGIVYFLLRYKRQNNLAAWLEQLRRDSIRAGKDEAFRQEQLAEAEAAIARYKQPEVIAPVKRNQEIFLQVLPKLLFLTGSVGAALIFMGLFKPLAEGESNWMMTAGPVLLGVTALLLVLTEWAKSQYGRVQQINRKYLMQKVGNDVGALLPTLEAILQYYPTVPQLRMEYADQLVRAGRLDDAIAAMRKARELAPGELDLAVVELSFQLRKNNLAEGEKILQSLPEFKMAPSDPRQEIYAAVLALKRNEQKKALKHLEKAIELDQDFTWEFMTRDETVAAVAKLGEEAGLIDLSKKEDANPFANM